MGSIIEHSSEDMTANRQWAPPTASRAVALEVLRHGPIARREIARNLDLTVGSLSRLSAPLISAGLILEVGEPGERRVGRPSRLLDVKPDSNYFIGVKITGTSVVAVLTDFRASVIERARASLTSKDPELVADVAAEVINGLSSRVPRVTGVGIGVGGPVHENSRVILDQFLDWQDVPLRDLVQARITAPVTIENDTTAFTEAQHWFGPASTQDRFAVVTLGAGTGFGMVVHDRIVKSEQTGIGLIQHWPLDPDGPPCPLGHRGCAMSMLTIEAITRGLGERLGRPVTYEQGIALCVAGDPEAARVLGRSGAALGLLLACIANLADVAMIVLGGEGVALMAAVRSEVDRALLANRDPRANPVELVAASADDLEWCRGAAVVAIQQFVLRV